MKNRLLSLIALLCLLPLAAWAQKTDIVILENGDRITGEIKRLEAGLLNFSTDTMGTVNIEWRFIRRIISDKYQSMEMRDGTRLLGQLQKSDESDEIVVKTEGGPITIHFDQVVSAWPVQATFRDRMDLDISFGFNYQRATDIADVTSAVDFHSKNNLRVTEASWRGSKTQQSGGTDQFRWELKGAHQYMLANQRFRTWFATAESNDAQGVDFRITAGGAFGKFLVKTNSQWFSLAAGLSATEERPDQGDAEANLEAVGAMRYRYFRFADPERSLDANFAIYPSLTDWGRYRASLRTTFKLELVQDLFWALEFWGNYDNQPISIDQATDKLDYGISTSIGWSY